ncbi:ornithine cyclodeaminase family protein [Nocardioides daeguensis]|uniref:Ornithine cyclodeaminase family protein n=1 Tax=Nocardioides daeguensis TaxID=908359 RepID=A0ABP6V308_9ACTN|nr:hypothetical protein [Nocardioides daeguensis]MBV6727197.1 hypothetical protein [Nocardioides daeguensis]MCR1771211.1 hypothetical protein [Nocardioides daeguensis]
MLTVFPADEVLRLVDLDLMRAAIREVHIAHARGEVAAPGRIDAGTPGEEFHVKTGQGARAYAVKANSGFFANPPARPAIQGAILVFDAADGTPRAVVHSATVTRLRTAAASCVAIEALRPHARQVVILGTGAQAHGHERALRRILPDAVIELLGRDQWDPERAAPADDVRALVRAADVVITCTPARHPLVGLPDVAPGALVVAVGADGPGKQELGEDLVAAAVVVCDVAQQAADVGEAQHCIRRGSLTTADLVEIGAVLAGQVAPPGADTLTVYDSTGTGFQDAAAAETLLESAHLLPPQLHHDW